jgi:hypothetical protein
MKRGRVNINKKTTIRFRTQCKVLGNLNLKSIAA